MIAFFDDVQGDGEPECYIRGQGGHDWIDEKRLASAGHGYRVYASQICSWCGAYKFGVKLNDGQRQVRYVPRDMHSAAWLVRRHEANGWIPKWLADYIGIEITLRMTKQQAVEWVRAHRDDAQVDPMALEHAFGAIMGVQPCKNQSLRTLLTIVTQALNL